MNKRYVKAYYDWIEQTAALSDAERGRLFIAILEYARSGLEPNLGGREGILFPVFRATLDRDNKIAETNSKNGALGGRGNKAVESETKRNKANESDQKATKEKRKRKRGFAAVTGCCGRILRFCLESLSGEEGQGASVKKQTPCLVQDRLRRVIPCDRPVQDRPCQGFLLEKAPERKHLLQFRVC